MSIENITLEGFRNLGHTSLGLRPITALVSLNSFGKSNLLAAIEFAISFITAGPQWRKRMMGDVYSVPLNRELDHRDFSVSFTLRTKVEGMDHLVRYAYSFEWQRDGRDSGRIVSESLAIREDLPGKRFVDCLAREGQDARFRPSRSARCTAQLGVDECTLALDRLALSPPQHLEECINAVRSLRAFIDDRMDASGQYSNLPRPDADDIDGRYLGMENIPYSLYRMKMDRPLEYSRLVDIFLSLFPDITGLEVTETDISKDISPLFTDGRIPFTVPRKVYSLWVLDRNLNQPLDYRFLSSGAKRILMLFTHITNVKRQGVSLVCLEEPETSIHPALFKAFLNTLEDIAGDMKIILTSHSPYLIQYFDLDGIYLGLPSDNGVAGFRTFASRRKMDALVRDAQSSDTLIGDYIFSLMSGNPVEREILASYLGES